VERLHGEGGIQDELVRIEHVYTTDVNATIPIDSQSILIDDRYPDLIEELRTQIAMLISLWYNDTQREVGVDTNMSEQRFYDLEFAENLVGFCKRMGMRTGDFSGNFQRDDPIYTGPASARQTARAIHDFLRPADS